MQACISELTQVTALASPCDLVIDAIADPEKRVLARGLLFYAMNTSTVGTPSDHARRLASMSVEQLRARQVAAERHCALDAARRADGLGVGR